MAFRGRRRMVQPAEDKGVVMIEEKYVLKSCRGYLMIGSDGNRYSSTAISDAALCSLEQASKLCQHMAKDGFYYDIVPVNEKPKVKTREEAVESLANKLTDEFCNQDYGNLSYDGKEYMKEKAEVILKHIDTHIISLGELEG